MCVHHKIENIIEKIVKELSSLPFIEGIVLGGSRATGTATEDSDIDIGIYYDPEKLNYESINTLASKLDDKHGKNLICHEGEWGQWVNCGGWLIIDGFHVDFILRDIKRVRSVIEECEIGNVTSHYQTGHPHAYINVMYRGELAISKILYVKTEEFTKLKKKGENYPPKLQKALISFFLFEAQFSCMFAKNNTKKEDAYYIAGHLFRSISALNQVLFAINKKYCLNEKKAIYRIDTFKIKPSDYVKKVNNIFFAISDSLISSTEKLENLYEEVKNLCP